jgi:hypothetical protein
MPAPQILKNSGSISGPALVGRIHLSEPVVAGTLIVKDGQTVVATISYAGPGNPEPAALVFNPPKQFTQGVHILNTTGGIAHVY